MKSFYLAKSLLFLCSGLIFVNLLEISKTDIFSLDSLIQLGLLMVTLELGFKAACSQAISQKAETSNTTSQKNKNYSYILSKIGTSSVLIGFIIQTLAV